MDRTESDSTARIIFVDPTRLFQQSIILCENNGVCCAETISQIEHKITVSIWHVIDKVLERQTGALRAGQESVQQKGRIVSWRFSRFSDPGIARTLSQCLPTPAMFGVPKLGTNTQLRRSN